MRDFTARAKRWLDNGYGACHLAERRWANDLKERLYHLQNESYLLSCWVIMPRHCHAVTRPFDGHVLEDLLGATKGVSARHINNALDETGPLWEEESYDRFIRDEEHLWRVIQYTGRNRRLAGLQHKEQWRR